MRESKQTSEARTIAAAEGYCDLRMWQDAWDELEALPPEKRAAPAVFRLRLRIFVALERWESAAILAESMTAKGDQSAETWLQGAESIQHARSAGEAKAFLEQAEAFLGNVAAYHYKLARFACVSGDMAACKERLARCFVLDPTLRLASLDDGDLAPFW